MKVFPSKSWRIATLSNCGDVLRAQTTKLRWKHLNGQGNDLGYGKNV